MAEHSVTLMYRHINRNVFFQVLQPANRTNEYDCYVTRSLELCCKNTLFPTRLCPQNCYASPVSIICTDSMRYMYSTFSIKIPFLSSHTVNIYLCIVLPAAKIGSIFNSNFRIRLLPFTLRPCVWKQCTSTRHSVPVQLSSTLWRNPIFLT